MDSGLFKINSLRDIWQLSIVLLITHFLQLPTPEQLEAIVILFIIKNSINVRSGGK